MSPAALKYNPGRALRGLRIVHKVWRDEVRGSYVRRESCLCNLAYKMLRSGELKPADALAVEEAMLLWRAALGDNNSLAALLAREHGIIIYLPNKKRLSYELRLAWLEKMIDDVKSFIKEA